MKGDVYEFRIDSYTPDTLPMSRRAADACRYGLLHQAWVIGTDTGIKWAIR